MERPVSFDVTDYYPDGDDWSEDLVHINLMSGPSSPIQRRLTFDVYEALKGMKMFISMTNAGWIDVEKRFYKMTVKTDGLLHRSRFAKCIEIHSKEFALEYFDTLARRWNIPREGINVGELLELWCKLSEQSFDSRLKMFFDMADKDGDGRLTQEEVREFIRLTSSANNNSIKQQMVDEYASLIMEECDIYDVGYITIEILGSLLRNVETLCEITGTEETRKRTKKWHKAIAHISSSLIACLKKRNI